MIVLIYGLSDALLSRSSQTHVRISLCLLLCLCEQDRVETELGKLDAHLVVATEELHSTVAWLRAAGHILTSLHRPRIDSTPAAIMQREYFGSRLGGARTDHRLCRSGLSSVDGVDFRLKYRKLFMVHGHIFNPAYCVIFDHTGRYVISGSDDFLIKA